MVPESVAIGVAGDAGALELDRDVPDAVEARGVDDRRAKAVRADGFPLVAR